MSETFDFERLRALGNEAAARVDFLAADEIRIEGWFDGGRRRRLALRFFSRSPTAVPPVLGRLGGRMARIAAEGAFWRAVRHAATGPQWHRLTRSSYVVLYYHRLKGELQPGQERLDLPPSLFAQQVRLLRHLRFRPLSAEELIAFHDGRLETVPPRSYVITADDGYLDCVEPFQRHASIRPQLYVPTGEVGGRAGWASDAPLAAWVDLRGLASAGVAVGSHAHHHVALTDLDDSLIREQLVESRRQLTDNVPGSVPLLAYPHGRRDPRVAAAAADAGFRLAFTTDPGRNGAGTDPMQLRRVGVKAWDSRLSFLWKVLTGDLLPRRWEEWRIRRGLPSYLRPQPTRGLRGG